MIERTPRKILAIKIRPLAETLIFTAALRELARLLPATEIHVVANQRWASLLADLPFIHRVWPIERHARKVSRARAIARLGLQLRARKFDWALGFHGSPSVATLAFAAGARQRAIHFHGHRDPTGFANVPIPRRMHTTNAFQKDLDVLRAFGLAVGNVDPTPMIALQEEERAQAESYLSGLGINGPRLGLAIGANRPSKIWPVENYVELARRWCDATGGSVVTITKSGDEEVRDAFATRAKGIVPRLQIAHDDVNDADPRRMAALISRLNLLAGNDTGPRHLAVAAGIPSLTFFGPEEPFDWHPYDRRRHPAFFIPKLACRNDGRAGEPAWCGITHCTVENHRCMKGLRVDEALAQCLELERVSNGGPST